MSDYNEWSMKQKLLTKLKNRIDSFLESSELNISSNIVNKPRAVAEAFEEHIKSNFERILENDGTNYQPSTRAKATADLSFEDFEGNYYAIDIKTHCLGKWGMPNVISYKKLDKFYEHDTNNFVVLLVEYSILNNKVTVERASLVPIEHLSWTCLAVQGTLGQIQIKNAEKIVVDPIDREIWLREFYNQVLHGIALKRSSLLKEQDYFLERQCLPCP